MNYDSKPPGPPEFGGAIPGTRVALSLQLSLNLRQGAIMAVSLKPLNEQVVVITGASSGIGLCTAMTAAKRGAKLVLASRSEQTLNEICQKIRAEGGVAI